MEYHEELVWKVSALMELWRVFILMECQEVFGGRDDQYMLFVDNEVDG